VLNRAYSSITWELPGNVPFEATKILVQEHTRLWGDPARACFTDVVHNTTRLLEKLLAQHFGQFSRLEDYVKWAILIKLFFIFSPYRFFLISRSLIFADRNKRQEDAYNTLLTILKLETNPVFTQNIEDLKSEEQRWLSYWNTGREAVITPAPSRPKAATGYNYSPMPMFTDHRGENLRNWSREDELKVMASVQAYFHVAHKVRNINLPTTMLACPNR